MSLCGDCHAKGIGCCNVGNKDVQFPISGQDVNRIKKATGLDYFKYVRVDKVNDEEYDVIKSVSPMFLYLLKGGLRFKLATQDIGGGMRKCRLLGPEGCLLKSKYKPNTCRLAPFWFDATDPEHVKPVILFEKRDCAVVKKSKTVSDICAAIGMTEDQVDSLIKSAVQDILLHNQDYSVLSKAFEAD